MGNGTPKYLFGRASKISPKILPFSPKCWWYVPIMPGFIMGNPSDFPSSREVWGCCRCTTDSHWPTRPEHVWHFFRISSTDQAIHFWGHVDPCLVGIRQAETNNGCHRGWNRQGQRKRLMRISQIWHTLVMSTHWWEKSTTNLGIWMLMIVNGCSPNLGTTVATGSANRPNYCGSGTSWVYFEGLRGLHELHHRRGHLGILGIVFSKKHGDHCTTFRDHWSRPFLLLSLMGLISKIFCFAAYFGMLDQIWTSYQTYSKTDKQLLDYFLFFFSRQPSSDSAFDQVLCGWAWVATHPFAFWPRTAWSGGWLWRLECIFSRNHQYIYIYNIHAHIFFVF